MTAAAGGAFDPQGPVARLIDDLWWVLLALGSLSFAVFAGVLVVALVRGRGSSEDPPADRPNRLIVLGGVVLPTVVLTIVLVATVRTMHLIPDAAAEGAVRIEITGHRWWWEVRYPDAGVETANEVHLPVGRPVELRLTSADVIHSFWIPVLAGKMDLLPEDVNTMVLQADEPGVHRSQCAEFCGLQHAKMRFVAVVEPVDEFEAWLDGQSRGAAEPRSRSARAGQQVFASVGCARCHTIRGSQADGRRGPDLTHIGTRRTLAAGTLENTREHLLEWISNPQEVKTGVDMPDLDLDERELTRLVDYLEGLR